MEHIQNSKVNPESYQFKNIYAYEEISKLSFQQTTTEDMNGIGEVGDVIIIPLIFNFIYFLYFIM